MFQTLNIILAGACFGSFIWSIKKFFIVPDGMKRGMKIISISGALMMSLHLIFLFLKYPANPLYSALGSLLYLISLTLFWWAIQTNKKQPLTLAFCQDKPQHLVETGPYKWVRHPFYTSYTCAWLAGVFATGEIILLATVLVMFYFYRKAALLEEAKFLKSELSTSYQNYLNRTGRFIPFV